MAKMHQTMLMNMIAIVIGILLCNLNLAQAEEPDYKWPQSDKTKQAVTNFQDMRFGMFIHWGPVSLTGQEIGWSRGRQTPIEKYDDLYQQFNPTKFDAEAWVRVAKETGMKYIVITTKHHDGFCLWPSKYTDYHIGNSPFKRDVLKELSQACKKQGIGFGTYYSTCDWHHPDFPLGSPGGRTKKPNPNLARYDLYLQNQVKELVTNYGPLTVLWFDVPQVYDAKYGVPMVKMLRQLQPDIVINNRAYAAKGRTKSFSKQITVGDYTTPEQHIGGFNRERPWETCMTICRQWAWKPNDQMKSAKQCIQTLLYTVGGDGNLLFNVGPMPDGRIEPRQVERLKEMGAWLKKYDAGVYGTRGGPFKPGKWGAATCKNNKIYLYIMNWPNDKPLELPAIKATITESKLLSGGQLKIKQTDKNMIIDVPVNDRNEIATVIELTVDRQAFDIEPVAIVYRSDSLAFGKKTTASNVYQKMNGQHGPAKALDDNPETRWATDSGISACWMDVDLGKPTNISRVMIIEPQQYKRVRSFELQYMVDKKWKTFHTGTTIVPNRSIKIEPITAQRVRLNILKATDGPTISEFQLFGKYTAPD